MTKEEQIAALDQKIFALEADLDLYAMDEVDDKKINLAKLDDQIARLEAHIAGGEQVPVSGPTSEEWADKSTGERSLAVAGQMASTFNEFVVSGVDLLATPFEVALEALSGQDLPGVSEVAKENMGIGADFMPEGAQRTAADMFGITAGFGMGLAQTARAGTTVKDVMLDITGLGSSAGTETMKQTQKTVDAFLKSDARNLGNPATMSESQIYQAAQDAVNRVDVDANRRNFEAYEAQVEMINKEAKKQKVDSPVIDEDIIVPIRVANIGHATKALMEMGIPAAKTLKAVRANGGLKFEETMEGLIGMDKQFTSGGGKGVMPHWYDRNFLPIADAVRRYSSPKVGNFFEKAVETSVRYGDVMTQRHLNPLKGVIKLLNEDRELKRNFLDLHLDPTKMDDIRLTIGRTLGKESLEAFNKFMQDARTQNARAMKSLYKDVDEMTDEWYVHSEVRKSRSLWNQLRGSARPKEETRAALRDRGRKPASKMEDTEVDDYVNPILSHFKHMVEEDQLIRMAEEFNLRPSMSKNGNAAQFFDEVRNKLARDGLGEDQSSVGAGLMQEAFLGAKRTPPPMVRAFMSQAYAGTLAQIKSAVLNTHDGFVAAFTQGGMNTLKGLTRTIKGEFGKSLDEMGMSGQGVGEFVRNFDTTLDDPTIMDKLAEGTRKFTDGAMVLSGFRKMDQYGKGVVLRASVNKMREAARTDTMWQEFGDIATREQLQKIKPYLQSKGRVADMPQDVAAVVEELAFVALGKQQLISAAGRPLGYLKHPLLRPAYALSGFAIKQQALIRDLVIDNIAKGDYAEAGKQAARYTMYAGMGYGVLNEGRSVVFKNEDPDVDDVALGVADQLAAAATMNRLGSTYDREKFSDNPVAFLMQSFIPPGGLVEAMGKDVAVIMDAIAGGTDDVPDSTLSKVPVLGDFYKYYWKKEQRGDPDER